MKFRRFIGKGPRSNAHHATLHEVFSPYTLLSFSLSFLLMNLIHSYAAHLMAMFNFLLFFLYFGFKEVNCLLSPFYKIGLYYTDLFPMIVLDIFIWQFLTTHYIMFCISSFFGEVESGWGGGVAWVWLLLLLLLGKVGCGGEGGWYFKFSNCSQ